MKVSCKNALILTAALLAATSAHAEVRPSKLIADHMVLQRGKPVAIFGIADPQEKIAVAFGGQTLSATADAEGYWQVLLPAMAANPRSQEMTISGSNTIVVHDVLVGDVWLCSGQSNMDMALGSCNRKEDIESADFPGIRSFRTPHAAAANPRRTIGGDPRWNVCSPSSAGGFSAAAFYFARNIYRENQGRIPIGLIVSSVGGTSIDLWLVPEGVVDIPALHPLLAQPVLPSGPFHLGNGMIAPLAPYGIKGAIWYQGENAEKTVQSRESYFLKMKALVQGWKRLWAMDDFPFYYVMIANWGIQPANATPVFRAGGWDADTRLQQANAMALPHAGCASALDVGDSSMGDHTWDGWHPKDKLDVGERLALWALKNDYGRSSLVASGPMLRDVAISGHTVLCSFDFADDGLMVGSKAWYRPTRELPEGKLQRFVIAGADGKWHAAAATIQGKEVHVSSPSVPEPRKVSYACWGNPEGCNLYNKAGLPAAPFHVDDVAQHYRITASAGPGGEVAPTGTHRVLPRTASLYSITPKPGYFIEDVKIDGVSVGSVAHYTFDPADANHTLEATFSQQPPRYTITVANTGGGAIAPSGTVAVNQGGEVSFSMVSQPGILAKSLAIDGVDVGPRQRFTFCDVRRNHTLAAAFACKLTALAGYGGRISPCGDMLVNYGDNATIAIDPIPGYSLARVMVDGKDMGAIRSYRFDRVATAHTISAEFKADSRASGAIPRSDQLIAAGRSDSLPAAGTTGAWPLLFPRDDKLSPIGSPTTVKICGRAFSRNRSLEGDGFVLREFSRPIACEGACLVVAARPVRNGGSSGWCSIVDVFYDRLVLGVLNDSGLVCVRRNGPIDKSAAAIPDGQITILSLVVQPDGKYEVYANGAEIMARPAAGDMRQLAPGQAGFAKSITLGRNAPDAWTAFNGDIGDFFLYKVALSDADRRELEAYIACRLTADTVSTAPHGEAPAKISGTLAKPAEDVGGTGEGRPKQAHEVKARLVKKYGDRFLYEIDDERRVVIATNTDALTLAEIKSRLAAHARALRQDLFEYGRKGYLAVVVPKSWANPRVTGHFYPDFIDARMIGSDLTHEFTHALHFADQQARGQTHPVWIMEGLASLYEDSRIVDGHAVLRPNHRLSDLQTLVKDRKHVPWAQMIALEHRQFTSHHYGQARYMLMYLHETGQLKKWYDAYTAGFDHDPTGGAALEQVFGKKLADIEKAWCHWVLKLSPPPLALGPGQGSLGIRIRQQPDGIEIVATLAEGGAAKAGLVAGDVILRLNGERVIGSEDLIGVVGQHRAGDELKVGYRRAAERRSARVTLTPAPVPAAAQPQSRGD